MHRNLGLGLLGLVLALVSASSSVLAEDAPRPHIVLFLADDLGYADCGFSGGQEIRTPHLDRLASAGTVLSSFYVQPVCSPTRAALMTGRYPMRLGLQVGVIRPWAEYGLSLEERVLPQALGSVGYATGIFGKWHLGSHDPAYWPNARGFDHFYGHLFGAIDYFTHERGGVTDWFRNGERLEEKGYTTDLLAAEAVRWIESRDAETPFFLYLPFNAVHTPLQAPEDALAPYAHLPAPRQKLAAMLSRMDTAIGRVVEAIEKKGLRERTLFIFSSDNGGYRPGVVTDNGPLRAGKGTVYEGGVRAAAFATWDGQIPAGKRVDTALHIVDWYPTLLRLAGAKLEQERPIDGRDLWLALTEGKASPHEEILFNTTPTGGALRAGDWKIVVRNTSVDDLRDSEPAPRPRRGRRGVEKDLRAVELFDLSKDLGEKTNLADAHPERMKELLGRYERLAKEAVEPLRSPPNPPRSARSERARESEESTPGVEKTERDE